jgi:uncharacterized protein (DUF4415 family)
MKAKHGVGSSRRGRLVVKSDADIRRYLNTAKGKRERERARAYGSEPSAQDLKEIPELTDAEMAQFFRPRKQRISVRVDCDILAWLKSGEGAYQTRLNQLLREAMRRETVGK